MAGALRSILAWWLKPGNTQSKNEVVKPLPLIEDADIGTPIQCMTWIERRKTLITSTDGSINLFELSSKVTPRPLTVCVCVWCVCHVMCVSPAPIAGANGLTRACRRGFRCCPYWA